MAPKLTARGAEGHRAPAPALPPAKHPAPPASDGARATARRPYKWAHACCARLTHSRPPLVGRRGLATRCESNHLRGSRDLQASITIKNRHLLRGFWVVVLDGMDSMDGMDLASYPKTCRALGASIVEAQGASRYDTGWRAVPADDGRKLPGRRGYPTYGRRRRRRRGERKSR